MGGGPAAAWAEAANLVRRELRPAPGKSLRNPKTLFLGLARKYPAPGRRGQLRTQEVGKRSVHRSVHSKCGHKLLAASKKHVPIIRKGWEGKGQTPEASGSPSRWQSFCPGPGIGEPGVADEPLCGEQISAPCLPPVEPPDPTGCSWQLSGRRAACQPGRDTGTPSPPGPPPH